MKRLTCIIATIAIAGTWTVVAQPPGGRGGQGGRGGHQGGPPPNPVMEAIDADGDNVISAREITGAAAALKKLDRNKDGQLTDEEIQPSHGHGGPGHGGGQGGPRGGQSGPPGGNRGPGGEHGHGQPRPEQFIEHAMTFDANKDGMISKTELTKMAKAVTEEMSRRGGDHGPGGGGPGGGPGHGGRPAGDEGQSRQRPPVE